LKGSGVRGQGSGVRERHGCFAADRMLLPVASLQPGERRFGCERALLPSRGVNADESTRLRC
jgi:hypothetical protein